MNIEKLVPVLGKDGKPARYHQNIFTGNVTVTINGAKFSFTPLPGETAFDQMSELIDPDFYHQLEGTYNIISSKGGRLIGEKLN